MKVFKFSEVRSLMRDHAKVSLNARCCRATIFNAIAGNRCTHATAMRLLVFVREQFGIDPVAIEIGGEIHFAPDALQKLQAENAELYAQLAEKDRENAQLRSRLMRRVLTAADFGSHGSN